jgi:hypothetical protein
VSTATISRSSGPPRSARNIPSGAAAGAIVGALLVGILVLIWSGLDDRGWVFALMVGWFAAAGALLGAFAAVFRVIGFSESMELTLEGQEEPGEPVWLAVYGDADRVRPAVEATGPVEIVDEPDLRTTHPDIARAS